jgi:hypothetical protein
MSKPVKTLTAVLVAGVLMLSIGVGLAFAQERDAAAAPASTSAPTQEIFLSNLAGGPGVSIDKPKALVTQTCTREQYLESTQEGQFQGWSRFQTGAGNSRGCCGGQGNRVCGCG